MSCPKCGLEITTTSGMRQGTKTANYADNAPVRMMVCARCETAIARWDNAVLALDGESEKTLPSEVRQTLEEVRNELRLAKALGRIKVPTS